MINFRVVRFFAPFQSDNITNSVSENNDYEYNSIISLGIYWPISCILSADSSYIEECLHKNSILIFNDNFVTVLNNIFIFSVETSQYGDM